MNTYNRDLKLDVEEKELIDSIERDEWVSVLDEKERAFHEAAAKETLKHIKKNKRINIRVNERDLSDLKVRAFEEGIPYQTLVSSIIHKFVSGRLVEKPR